MPRARVRRLMYEAVNVVGVDQAGTDDRWTVTLDAMTSIIQLLLLLLLLLSVVALTGGQ